jgi:SDR family mycofactocin-dependent oxidoreductase
MADLKGKVAFITGAARGQGRSHALTLARAGADIIAVDICGAIESVGYPLATPSDLETTVREVEETGRRIVARAVDVRDQGALRDALEHGVGELGGLDIVIANAGIASSGPTAVSEQAFQDVIAVNLTGVWNTVIVARPILVEQGRGGAIVLISSTAGLKAISADSAGGHAYVASKHAVVGLMRTFASVLAAHNVRVNSVHPAGVNTPMIDNDAVRAWLADPDLVVSSLTNLLPVEVLEPVDISNAVLWLVSDEARFVTGVVLPVDAGFSAK